MEAEPIVPPESSCINSVNFYIDFFQKTIQNLQFGKAVFCLNENFGTTIWVE